MKNENQIKRDFYEELEYYTYTKKEIPKYSGSVKFFVSEARVKRAFNRAYRELDRTLRGIYRRHKPPKTKR